VEIGYLRNGYYERRSPKMEYSLDEYIRQLKEQKLLEKRKQNLDRRERTKQKISETSIRIEELSRKISRLERERENLLRKQASRMIFLEETSEK
jgi:predicted RNase H-like nuclease (RuvC/YqgF family)